MSDWNIAAKSKDEQDKVNVDLAASGVAYKERLNMPVVAEQVAREQPEHCESILCKESDTIEGKALSD
ncbi:TPA: DNA polymerase III subunit theta [Salmonella enterica subsp. enterica serovar Ball]|nr:DNA polymerase III subunit theta [Salmonella enterica subsp. enterica serovar Ball]HCA3484863.1 DNA polymerase III subunit theta [Salmonella enterica subsp. enterica serovar Ball]HCA3563010.1 DNA polymerase III subunit theta [Salmonella enterica subsp. enterica serovar Ball]